MIAKTPRSEISKSLLVRGLEPGLLDDIKKASRGSKSQNDLVKEALKIGLNELKESKAKRTKTPVEFTFIDLFAGIGGFHLGMKANGGECVFTSEWDKYAAATYMAWHKGHTVVSDDIRSIDYQASIPDHDVLCAGFPCQPFSIAGVSKKNSLGRAHGFEDEKQGNLFFAIAEIARIKRPPVLLLENVKNLKSHDKGNTWKVISETLDALDYEVHHKIIDARHWVPQHRERIFIVCFDREAFTKEEISSFQFPEEPKKKKTLGDILEKDAPEQKYMLTDGLWRYLQDYAEKHRQKGNGFGFQLVGSSDVTRTMSARYYKDGSEILIRQEGWRNPRRLTPREASRLMGFNGKFARAAGHSQEFPQVVSDVQAYKQFGNSVSPLVVEAIGKELLAVLRKRKERLSE